MTAFDRKCLLGVTGAAAIGFALSTSVSDARENTGYLMLKDRLDRPQDGYCLDIPGAGSNFRLDKPLTVHNCKPGSAPDGVVEHRANGTLYFPAFDLCVTAMGTNRTVVAGASLMPKPCVENGAFADGPSQKTFSFTDEGKLTVAESGLCVVAGPQSATTFSSSHRWRSLFVESCNTAPKDRSVWEIVPTR